LLRVAWLVIQITDHERASRIAQSWFGLPYSTFKRLALFAASQDGCIDPDQWVSWLLADKAWWLWSDDTNRETMRLLVLQGANLPPHTQAELESLILVGPPRAMYPDDIELEVWQSYKHRSVWLRLAKLRKGDCTLGDNASKRFDELSVANPEWKLASNERDEFSHWMSGTGDPDYEESRDIDIAPRKRRPLVKWLKQTSPARRSFYGDTWRETCRTRLFHSIYALCDLSREGFWPIERWREALQTWGEEGMVLRSWQYAAPVVQTMPDAVFQEILHTVTWWVKAVSKSIDRHETVFFDLCRRVLKLPHQDSMDMESPVTNAINHPVGHISEALLNLLFKREPNDNDTLPSDIEPFFTQLCDTEVKKFRNGRVLLASRLIALFRIDRPWTEEYLLPLLDWETSSTEAKAAWEGFLWSPRLYRPLLIAFKQQFLETAHHYVELGDHSKQFAAFLTYAALNPVEGYTTQAFQAAIEVLPQEGLQEAAQALSQALEGAGEQREDYWKNRVQPFWQHVWPKSRDLTSNGIAVSLARMSIAARGEFPAALSAVIDWLQPIEHPHYIVGLLCKSNLVERFPEDALRFLDAILENQRWSPRELKQCLATIADTSSVLKQDRRYQRLKLYSRQYCL